MTETTEIFDIIDQDGYVIEESLTLEEAADSVMRSDSREWEIRADPSGGFVAWSRQQVANRPWEVVIPLYSVESDEAAARDEISRKIVQAERWPGHCEAVRRDSRIESAARFAREEFLDADKPELLDAIRTHYNCRDVDVDAAGDVWIADPQTGHWLDDDALIALHKALA